MEQLEVKLQSSSSPPNKFVPDVSIVTMGLPHDEDEELAVKLRKLFEKGCVCEQMPTLVAMQRLQARGSGPRVVKVTFVSVWEKVAVLHGKRNLKSNSQFKKVYVRSAKSHTDQIMESNFKALLHEVPTGKDFYISGKGTLIKREAPEAAAGRTADRSSAGVRRRCSTQSCH